MKIKIKIQTDTIQQSKQKREGKIDKKKFKTQFFELKSCETSTEPFINSDFSIATHIPTQFTSCGCYLFLLSREKFIIIIETEINNK